MSSSPAPSSPFVVESTSEKLLTRLSPCDIDALAVAGLSVDSITMVELSYGSELQELWQAYAINHAKAVQSHSLNIGRKSSNGCCSDDHGSASKRSVSAGLGLGLHKLVTADDKVLYVLLQTLGEPVGSDCGATLYKSMVIISPAANDIEYLRCLSEALVTEADKVEPHSFTCWRWNMNFNRWMRGSVAMARSIESVVLPAATQTELLSDIDEFMSKETKDFYLEHGIPHKRAYLFHGKPGAGKTSVIQALAGRYGRNVCYLSANPEMTDDSLKSAVEYVPHKSIIVLEDVDALFDSKREKKDQKSVLTFSGLLNALDGVGGCSGQLFILTTNHRERLDPALIRNGRVDVHIEFTDASEEQMRGLFLQFHKGAPKELAEDFQKALVAKLDGRAVSMAALQGFFVSMRKASPEETIGSVGKILTELNERANAKDDAQAKSGQSAADGEKSQQDKGAADQPAAESAAHPSTASAADGMHIHVHVHK